MGWWGVRSSGWVKPVCDRRLWDLVSVVLLTRVFSVEVVDQVIADAKRTEQRNRSLPARDLVGRLKPGTLVLADRGFSGFGLRRQAREPVKLFV